MKPLIPIFVTLFLITATEGLQEKYFSNINVYFDPKTKIPLRLAMIEDNISNSTKINDPLQKRKPTPTFGYRANGCSCSELLCGCCVGLKFDQFNFSREACMNLTYDPYDFSIQMEMLMDGTPVFSNSISGRNPPPICIPVPLPYISSFVDFCVKLYDIHTPGQNLHVCLDFETRIQKAPVLVLHFDCMQMGADGIHGVKPGAVVTASNQEDADVYDEVTENKIKIKPNQL